MTSLITLFYRSTPNSELRNQQLPHYDVTNNTRRASDPIRRQLPQVTSFIFMNFSLMMTSLQVDANKLPTVPRHNSWNNMTPLPQISSQNILPPQQLPAVCCVT